MPYAILRFAKMKGGSGSAIEAHHERSKEKYASNPDVDTSNSYRNFHIVAPQGRYKEEIDSRITQANCRVRKDSVKYVDTLVTSGPEFFEGKSKSQVEHFFHRAVSFIEKKVGAQNIFSAVVHMDEKTPHMHLCFVPLTADNRLSAFEILGNRKKLCQWQDEFYAHMAEYHRELERGQRAAVTGRKHIPVQLYKQATQLDALWKQVKAALDSINRLNTPAKKEELGILLERWLPKAETFQRAIVSMERQNERLEQRIEGMEHSSANKDRQYYEQQMELTLLKNEYQRLRKTNSKNAALLAAIPKDLMEELKKINPEIQQILERGKGRQDRGR